MGLLLCLLALVGTFAAARRSVGAGFAGVLVAGYFYGVIRANVYDGVSHFMFDSAVLGLYVGHFSTRHSRERRQTSRWAGHWMWVLFGWPLLWFLVPIQHPLIQLVGLRAAVWFLPCVVIGARAGAADLEVVAKTFAALNMVALGFASYEYAYGIEAIYPKNSVTELLYISNDVTSEEGTFHRIPATFSNAHAYGGTMTATVPLLLNLLQLKNERWRRPFAIAGLFAALVGVFLCGARQPVVVLGLMFAAALVWARLSSNAIMGIGAIVAGVLVIVSQNERLQRFMTLQDTDYVATRVEHSSSVGVLELLSNYPLGNGLGSAAGTSIPSFLANLAPNRQIGVENEFGRIALEQSPMGAVLLLAFILVTLARRPQPASADWAFATRLIRVSCIFTWAAGMIGTGLLVSVPASVVLLFHMGVLARVDPLQDEEPASSDAQGFPALKRV